MPTTSLALWYGDILRGRGGLVYPSPSYSLILDTDEDCVESDGEDEDEEESSCCSKVLHILIDR